MATSPEYAAYVCDQLGGTGDVRCRRMFGEYMVYVNDKPLLLVCDNCAYVKMLPELAALMAQASIGVPYEGAKPHYILDIDSRELCRAAVAILEPLTPLPKPKAKKAR